MANIIITVPTNVDIALPINEMKNALAYEIFFINQYNNLASIAIEIATKNIELKIASVTKRDGQITFGYVVAVCKTINKNTDIIETIFFFMHLFPFLKNAKKTG